jgi:hypothetical protein
VREQPAAYEARRRARQRLACRLRAPGQLGVGVLIE